MKENNQAKNNNAWIRMNEEETTAAYNLGNQYVDFLNRSKTVRETINYIGDIAMKNGFIRWDSSQPIQPGQKLFIEQKGKIGALIIVGTDPLEQGINMVVSHIDAPRLDLKPRPLFESDELAFLKTHYYGGIKKYQWLAIPLALHGIFIKPDGTTIKITIGENPDDPVFTIADLLPHLAKDQMEKKMSEAIKGENMNALTGSRPEDDQDAKNPVKEYVLKLLQEKYDIDEDDFTSAELELVPALPARDVGLDRSMTGAYGQDDRVCAFTSLQAILQTGSVKRTAMCFFADKEEIGSTGNTGLQSLLLENLITDLMHGFGQADYYKVRQCLANSSALSADVNAAIDPNYPEVFEKMNNSFLSHGVVLTKYTGSRGKYDSNDANPEYLARLRQLFARHEVIWQVGELGKIDIGGGGTVAQYLARYGMEVVDCGPAVLGMHSPFEVTSKADLYMSYKAYRAFLQEFSF
ncbi:MAG: aminopeptidase [Syntrophomonadaceae bacterium]|jgi:aspartyl aminopeptidase